MNAKPGRSAFTTEGFVFRVFVLLYVFISICSSSQGLIQLIMPGTCPEMD